MAMVGNVKPKPGDRAILTAVPPGLLDDLPLEDQQAITEIVGKPVALRAYDEDGRAELEFRDRNGNFHVVYVKPDFIKKAL
jgi:hypothetical protein